MTVNHKRGKYGAYLPTLQTLIDILIINMIFGMLFLIVGSDGIGDNPRLIWAILNIAIIPTWRYFSSVHSIRSSRAEKIVTQAIKGLAIHASAVAALTLLIDASDKTLIFCIKLYGIALIILPSCWLTESLILKSYRKRGINICRIIIVGTGDTARRLFKEMRSNDSFGYQIIGFFGDGHPGDLNGLFMGGIDKIDNFCKQEAIDEIYFASSVTDEYTLEQIVKIANDNMCQFYYIPPISQYIQHNFTIVPFNDSIPAMTIHPSPLQSWGNRLIKRSFDIVFSGILLILSPVILIPVAIAIKLSSPGPIFFRQTRTGYQGKNFTCYKFRSMRVNPDSDKIQATSNDNRTTRLGRFLRHSSIDELPQFWNVFKGDMSVVGPRPHMLAHTEAYRNIIDSYMIRHMIKPGITGWAQVFGYRGATDELWQMKRRVEYDVWYIEHWSFMLDMKIIFKTVINAICGEKNAY